MKWIKRLVWAMGIGYLLLCLVLYLFQERLIFRPNTLPPDYAFEQGSESALTTPDGIKLSVVSFQQPNPAGAILYLHGNRGSNRRSLYQTRDLIDTNYDLYLFDYRGYGKSGGSIASEEQLYTDAQLVYDTLARRYGDDNIILVGYSMGTGMASYLAANEHPRHCVLVAPYASITAMKNLWLWAVPDFILKYPLNNVEHVAQANCPITILHGDRDGLIPFAMAEELREAAPDRVELIELDDTGHRGAIMHPEFLRTMQRLMSK